MYLTLPISTPVQVMIVLCTVILCGCMSFEEGWKQFKKPTRTGDVSVLLGRGYEQLNEADNRQKILDIIKTLEAVLEIDPYNYEALSGLGGLYFFVGVAYSDNKEEKKEYYLASVKYNEQAMYTNLEFKNLVDEGAKVSEACRVLSERELPPMFYWWAAGGSYWAECLNWASKLISLFQVKGSEKVLDRMLEIDPTWDGGRPYIAKATNYAVLPKLMGGDLDKAEELFDKAIKAGPNWLHSRSGRAKHLWTKTKDREAFKEDLEWILAQDPRKADSPYSGNVYLQREARDMLANIDDYF